MGVSLLLVYFILSLGGQFICIASMTRSLFGTAEEVSRVIFWRDEENVGEVPAATPVGSSLAGDRPLISQWFAA